MTTLVLILAGWVAIAIGIGAMWALIAGKRRERDELLEEIYDSLRRRRELYDQAAELERRYVMGRRRDPDQD